MGEVRMTITYKDPTSAVIDEAMLEKRLYAMGLLGRKFDFYGEASFAPGEKFRKLIKTDLEIEEKKKGFLSKIFGNKQETFPPVRITLETNSEVEFDCSPEDLENVTCPNCAKEIEDWIDENHKWFSDNNYIWHCETCKTALPPYKFDYKRLGAFSRQKINIWNVGKEEGEPTDELLDELRQMTEIEFDYYYVRI